MAGPATFAFACTITSSKGNSIIAFSFSSTSTPKVASNFPCPFDLLALQVARISWSSLLTRRSVILKTFHSTFKTSPRPCTIEWWNPNARLPSITPSLLMRPSPEGLSGSSSISITKMRYVVIPCIFVSMCVSDGDCGVNSQFCHLLNPRRTATCGRTPSTTTPSP